MQFRLRTLLLVLAIGPPMLAWSVPAVLSRLSVPAIYIHALDFTSPVRDIRPYLTTAAAGDGKLVIGKRSYGLVKAEDPIRLGPGDDVFVNGQRRWSE
jgi:hypothetical protein